MSVVAWDGRSMAADKQGVIGDARMLTTKIRRSLRFPAIMAWCGGEAAGLAMAHWFENGAMESSFPAVQSSDQWSRLIVWQPGLNAPFYFEGTPYRIVVHEQFMAWGSGRDFALAAMACGKSAAEAVEITCRFSINCGMGVDVLNFDDES